MGGILQPVGDGKCIFAVAEAGKVYSFFVF